MALIFALIGGLIIGGVSNSTAGFLSFVVIWFLMGAFEEDEAKIRVLLRKIGELEADLNIARNTWPSPKNEWHEDVL